MIADKNPDEFLAKWQRRLDSIGEDLASKLALAFERPSASTKAFFEKATYLLVLDLFNYEQFHTSIQAAERKSGSSQKRVHSKYLKSLFKAIDELSYLLKNAPQHAPLFQCVPHLAGTQGEIKIEQIQNQIMVLLHETETFERQISPLRTARFYSKKGRPGDDEAFWLACSIAHIFSALGQPLSDSSRSVFVKTLNCCLQAAGKQNFQGEFLAKRLKAAALKRGGQIPFSPWTLTLSSSVAIFR